MIQYQKKWVYPGPGDILERLDEETGTHKLFAIFDQGKFWRVYKNGELGNSTTEAQSKTNK